MNSAEVGVQVADANYSEAKRSYDDAADDVDKTVVAAPSDGINYVAAGLEGRLHQRRDLKRHFRRRLESGGGYRCCNRRVLEKQLLIIRVHPAARS